MKVAALEIKLTSKDEEIARLREELGDLQHRLANLHEREVIRSDKLFDKQEEILDQRLGLRLTAPTATSTPIPRRANFGKIRSDFEKRQKDEFWKKRIDEVEGRDLSRDKAKVGEK